MTASRIAQLTWQALHAYKPAIPKAAVAPEGGQLMSRGSSAAISVLNIQQD